MTGATLIPEQCLRQKEISKGEKKSVKEIERDRDRKRERERERS